MRIRIREAASTDAGVITDFNIRLARETEDHRLDPGTVSGGVAAVLDDAAKGRYWIGEADGTPAGQLMLTYEWSDWRNAMIWWIQSVYVAEPFRRRGVFSTLFRHVESAARADAGVCGIRLYVEKANALARATYAGLGMSGGKYRVMELEFDRDRDDHDRDKS